MSLVRLLRFILLLLFFGMISGCNVANDPATPSYTPTKTITLTPVPPTPISPTNTPLPPPTPTLTPTPVWVFQSGTITCPILLYHRISEPPLPNSMAARYYTSPADFEWQMQALEDWGYTTIPVSLLVEAITRGAPLPPRPVVISFDDGDVSVSENAYPIMQEYGYTGILYLVGNYIGTPGYMDTDQIQILYHNGWEIGSHGMTHPHLPDVHDQLFSEGAQSKILLAMEIGASVQSFAYPFGEIDPFVVSKIAEYGYLAAVGLGTQSVHRLDTLYYLSRIEVRNGTDLAAFAALLPWSGQH